MSVDILGTSWDQCVSMFQYCFTSTETVRLVRTDGPGGHLDSHTAPELWRCAQNTSMFYFTCWFVFPDFFFFFFFFFLKGVLMFPVFIIFQVLQCQITAKVFFFFFFLLCLLKECQILLYADKELDTVNIATECYCVGGGGRGGNLAVNRHKNCIA